ncbi:hypothetical protein GH714_027781 [Hevea brasiliensis]|uniref:SBP-type domain-containing protein n=1 Tax=Hevea brasiliensis TaxID=3981 RepID=A0A6A6MFH7_HEVBR|nr:hypothetical protein GH714_027781 [Hevea brasiliensis]
MNLLFLFGIPAVARANNAVDLERDLIAFLSSSSCTVLFKILGTIGILRHGIGIASGLSPNPLDSDTNILQFCSASSEPKKKTEASGNHFPLKKAAVDEDDGLRLHLAGGLNSVEELVSMPNKRVRSVSPGTATYPMCQDDNCKENLSNAKDYQRRHKVCEVHSKSTKALVGKQMQRFCQQCSRFSSHYFIDFIDH